MLGLRVVPGLWLNLIGTLWRTRVGYLEALFQGWPLDLLLLPRNVLLAGQSSRWSGSTGNPGS